MDTEYLEINGRKYEMNCKGYLVEPLQWDVQVRDHFAKEEKIELTDNHHKVLELIRTFYLKNNEHPVLRAITNAMAETFSPDKANIKYFHVLFPGGVHQAYRIAGIPMKHSCC